MVHDYHLYTLPALVRARAAGRLPPPLRPHPVDAAGRLAGAAEPRSARRSSAGLLANDIIGFHTRAYRRNFLHCCRDLMELEVDYERGVVRHDGREVVGPRLPAAIDAERLDARVAESRACAEFERELLRRRREHLILRVDRADLSKNVLRGFTAFDIFLDAAPGVPRAGHLHRPPACRRARTCPSTPSTWSGSRRWSRSSTTATARPTGCRSTCKLRDELRRGGRRATSTTTC